MLHRPFRGNGRHRQLHEPGAGIRAERSLLRAAVRNAVSFKDGVCYFKAVALTPNSDVTTYSVGGAAALPRDFVL